MILSLTFTGAIVLAEGGREIVKTASLTLKEGTEVYLELTFKEGRVLDTGEYKIYVYIEFRLPFTVNTLTNVKITGYVTEEFTRDISLIELLDVECDRFCSNTEQYDTINIEYDRNWGNCSIYVNFSCYEKFDTYLYGKSESGLIKICDISPVDNTNKEWAIVKRTLITLGASIGGVGGTIITVGILKNRGKKRRERKGTLMISDEEKVGEIIICPNCKTSNLTTTERCRECGLRLDQFELYKEKMGK